jgi:hypothetical protein
VQQVFIVCFSFIILHVSLVFCAVVEQVFGCCFSSFLCLVQQVFVGCFSSFLRVGGAGVWVLFRVAVVSLCFGATGVRLLFSAGVRLLFQQVFVCCFSRCSLDVSAGVCWMFQLQFPACCSTCLIFVAAVLQL